MELHTDDGEPELNVVVVLVQEKIQHRPVLWRQTMRVIFNSALRTNKRRRYDSNYSLFMKGELEDDMMHENKTTREIPRQTKR